MAGERAQLAPDGGRPSVRRLADGPHRGARPIRRLDRAPSGRHQPAADRLSVRALRLKQRGFAHVSADPPLVSLSRDGAVALITIDNPPVNALSSDVRAGLIAALDGAIADKAVRAIVLACAGKSFCAGADIREFDLPPQPPHLTDVIQRFADAAKPVVAALRRAIDMSFADAVAYARADFLALRETPESKALRYAFFAEREAGRPGADVASGSPRALERAAVIGGGTMGQGIAIALLDAGLEVALIEADPAALARAQQRIGAHYEEVVAKGRMAPSAVPAIIARLDGGASIDAAHDADVVIEAVFEDIGVKREVFSKLDAIARPGALLATNTSYLDVAEIAGFTRRPQEVIGLHFFSPANVVRLVEIVRTDASSADALATGTALVKRLRKVGVVCKGKDGFIGNRMLLPRTRECLFMLEEGALPRDIDSALTEFGFAMGPLAVGDLAGLDIGWRNANLRRQLRELPGRDCDLLDRLVASHRLGQKTGAGWCRYEAGSRKPIPDPAVEAVLIEHSRERGIKRRAIPPTEIVERCLFG